jgi:hypothetical protein
MKPFIKMWMSAKNFKESHREWLHANVFDLNMDSIKQSGSTMISSNATRCRQIRSRVSIRCICEFPSALEFATAERQKRQATSFVSQLKFVCGIFRLDAQISSPNISLQPLS